MKRNQQRGIKSDKGFTMIELIIVIAIMGILSAVLVPSFSSMTIKTRLRADIATLQAVQMQIELYVAENGGVYPNTAKVNPVTDIKQIEGQGKYKTEQLPVGVGAILREMGYLNAKDIKDDGNIILQTSIAKIGYNNDKDHLILHVNDGKVEESKEEKIASQLTGIDKDWISKDEVTTPTP